MGFWKDVAYDISRGMSKEKAIELNYKLRYEKLSYEDRKKEEAKAEADIKLNSMK